MNQQLSALFSVQPAPANSVTASAAAANGTPSFADTFTDALGAQGTSDAVLQALGLPVAADVAVLAVAAATDVSSPTALDDGKVSPQNGTDLPLLLQLLDSSSALTPESTASVDLQDKVKGLDVERVEVDPAVLGWPMTSLDAQMLAANTVAGAGKQSSAGPQRTAVSASEAATLFATNSVNAGALTALAGSQQAQTALHDQHSASQHNSPYDLELSTSLTSALLPVKGASIEQFNLAAPALLETSLPDTPSVTTSAVPLNSVASLAPNLTATPFTSSGKFDLAVPQAPGQPGWGDVFADRVSFAVRQSLQEAEIRLNPPSLGQVDVRIVMHNDQANLMFSSPHSAVRDAIEASMGRLRDMLSDSGFSLVNVDVSDKSLAQQRDAREQRESESGSTQYSAEFELAANAPEVLHSSNRNIDYYI